MGSCPWCFSPPQSDITALLCPGLTVGSTTPPHPFSPLLALPPSLQEDTCYKSRPGVKSSVLSQAPMVHGHAHAPGRSELPGQREVSSSWSITVFQSYPNCGSCGCFEFSRISQAQADTILDQVTHTDLVYAVAGYPIQAPVNLTSLYCAVLAPLLSRAFPSAPKLGHHCSLL